MLIAVLLPFIGFLKVSNWRNSSETSPSQPQDQDALQGATQTAWPVASVKPAAHLLDTAAAKAQIEVMTAASKILTKPPADADRLALETIKDQAAAQILSERHDLSDPNVRARLTEQLQAADQAENKYLSKRAAELGYALVEPDGAVLVGFDGEQPLYDRDDNVEAAISIGTNLIRDDAVFSLDGEGLIIGLWEVSIPRLTHTEIAGRISVADGTTETSSHATHVAGTLIATGLNADVKGMAPRAKLIAHNSISAIVEMTQLAAAAPSEEGKILISNHSYGTASGWSANPWRWYGIFIDDNNPGNDHAGMFGRYNSSAAAWDGLAWNAPYYLPFKSAGNERDDDAPSNGTEWRYNSSSGTAYTYDLITHPQADYLVRVSNGISGFDTIVARGSAKNIMTVGSVTDAVSNGLRNLASSSLNNFSSAGPTDDGRIKPDIMANGNWLLSLDDDSDTDTARKSGTSMSSPSAAGSALLLQQYYKLRFSNQAMRSSTLKGLMIHSAEDMGNPGPDYRFGWGLLNAHTAANLIKEYADAPEFQQIHEGQIEQGASDTFEFYWDGTAPIKITLCWTDPVADTQTTHDSRIPRLVHDLNLKLTAPDGLSEYQPFVMPWVGDWSDAKLNSAATTGINNVDNVEQVLVGTPQQSGIYTLTINHQGSLSQGNQIYSLITSGGLIPNAGYGAWLLEYFPETWDDSATAGFSIDTDGDGRANGLDYALNVPPGAAANLNTDLYALQHTLVQEVPHIALIYKRDTRKTDIEYLAQWSTDLMTWNPLESISLSTDGYEESLKAQLPIGASKKFIRLTVNQIPHG